MPRTSLDRAAKRDPLKELILGRMGMIPMTQKELGDKVGLPQSSMSVWLKKPSTEWKLREIYRVASVLRIPKDEIREKI